MNAIRLIYCCLILSLLASCAANKPKDVFTNYPIPPAPDYSKTEAWSALPGKSDNPAERLPVPLKGEALGTEVDVFFVHPTTLLYKRGAGDRWNGDITDKALNDKTDNSPVQFQASIFNAAGKIYAPRYRQAHLYAYYTKDTASSRKAFELAYSDVKAAFKYYLDHYNNGRPIIIAAHSQGTTHAGRLMKEFFDNNPKLRNKLVVAYIIGMPIPKNVFNNIPVCQSPTQTGCFCAWRTFEKGFYPKTHIYNNKFAVVNPLTWTTDTLLAPASLNLGGVLTDFKKIRVGTEEAQIHDGLLWVNKPKLPWAWLVKIHNFHPGDLNFFYMDVRKDAKRRVGYFWK